MNGVIAMQHVVHHSKSGQDSASQQEVTTAKEKMRNRNLARLTPVQVCTRVFVYIKSMHGASEYCCTNEQSRDVQ